MQLGAVHWLPQFSWHCWPYPNLQRSQYRVLQGLVHERTAASLQSQVPVQVPLALQFSITCVLQSLQANSTLLHSLLHFKALEVSHAVKHCEKQSLHDIVGPGPGVGAGAGGGVGTDGGGGGGDYVAGGGGAGE